MKKHRRRNYWTSCYGKRPYRTMKHANADATAIQKKDGGDISAYECDYCASIHVGHTPGANQGAKHVRER